MRPVSSFPCFRGRAIIAFCYSPFVRLRLDSHLPGKSCQGIRAFGKRVTIATTSLLGTSSHKFRSFPHSKYSKDRIASFSDHHYRRPYEFSGGNRDPTRLSPNEFCAPRIIRWASAIPFDRLVVLSSAGSNSSAKRMVAGVAKDRLKSSTSG